MQNRKCREIHFISCEDFIVCFVLFQKRLSDVPKKLTFGQLHQESRNAVRSKYLKLTDESELEIAITAKYDEIKRVYDQHNEEQVVFEKVKRKFGLPKYFAKAL